MTEFEFQDLVEKTIKEIPAKLREKIQNVVFTVEPDARVPQGNEIKISRGNFLLGLYQGVPLTRRGIHYSLALPDKITFFKKNIEKISDNDPAKIAKNLKAVVLHEIAHYFGFSEAEIRKMEKAKNPG